ncbi:camphor resistance protein CrcB [Magnetococcus marinus MC-1]|uniref:Fluoride-specific ion channel FluC n=1 Tax=Magnetococcus marinus (strain ATCC BAA-1437 / JCM 17883 / MC-1) TaxID=156889 RepID=FLUC_MAGMM|nr:fluoride efflux transporter CrcB [Magnetococcus marinus]A0L889.1 RecName: Full=Fluoride-specific ion channel FluC [Magnetococcus marinus MC-1]ABK44182.1 camphor resistance protein CrcB [Magnetococcus marinus MC-1]
MQIAWVALGGAIGAVARYVLSNAVYAWLGRAFPWGTLSVNLLGSFIMGLLFYLFTQRLMVPEALKPLVLVGGLGAFTTFSTFSLETLNLMQSGSWSLALLNMLSSVLLCVLAAYLGLVVGRLI